MKDLINSILQTASKPELWDNTLDLFCNELNVTASAMFAVHEFSELRMNFAWSKYNRDHLTEEALDMLHSGKDDGDLPGYATMMRMPPQKPQHDTFLFGVDSYEDLPPSNVRDFTESIGLNRRTATLNKTGPWLDALFVQFKSQSEANRYVNDPRCEFLMPIIANSVSLGRMLEALRAQYKSALSMLDHLGLGVFLIDKTGCVIEANKEAQRILDLDDGISMALDKRLRLKSADKTTELNTMVSAANGLLKGDINKSNNLLAARRLSGEYDFLISVRPLSDDNAELEFGFQSAFITIIDPSRKDILSADGLQMLGQLSAAETNIVELLIQGFRLNDVADRRDVSMNTVKTQLKDISHKLRCNSQSDIIRVAAATRLPIGK